jgi:hypothetical protein
MSDTQTPADVVASDAAPKTEAAPQQKVRLTCPKHGDVTQTALLLNFPNGEKPMQFIYCLPCLNEVLLALQKEGAVQTLKVDVLNPDGTVAVPPEPAPDPTLTAVKKVIPNLISAVPAPDAPK